MENILWGSDYTYTNIDQNSTDVDKLNAVINVFAKNASPDYVKYDKLFITTHTEEMAFDGLIMETGYFDIVASQNSYHPGYKLNRDGHLMLKKYGSYLNYHTNATTQQAVERGNEYKENQRKEEIEALNKKLAESQIKINTLLLVKKPTWKERHWLWIAVFAWVVGVVTSIGLEIIKDKIQSKKEEAKTQIQERSDSAPLHK